MAVKTYFNVHMVSDSTGETLNTMLRAVSPLFEGIEIVERSYYLVRSKKQLDLSLKEIGDRPGLVLFTIASEELREELEIACRKMQIPAYPLLDGLLNSMSRYLGIVPTVKTGVKQALNEDYYKRIEAMNYTMNHDDGQMVSNYEEADIVLVGISRTSKTPTSIYLANRGFKTANYPLVYKQKVPEELLALKKPLVIGLKVSPDRLIAIRTNRLLSLNTDTDTEYVNEQTVREEVIFANRLFEKQGWDIIDVTRRSIEETAASIMNLLAKRKKLD